MWFYKDWFLEGVRKQFTAAFVSPSLSVKSLKCWISVGRDFNCSQMLPVSFDAIVGGQSCD